MCGDFNYPGIDWDRLQSDREGQKFLDAIMDCFMEQYVKHPTRGNNILDLVFGTEGTIISNVVVNEPIGSSDHGTVEFELILKTDEKVWKNVYFDYRNGNYRKVAEYLNTYNWEEILKNKNPSEA